MRLSISTVAAALFANTLAVPTSKPNSLANTAEQAQSQVVKRDGGDGKYFHEPGYVTMT